MFVQHKFNIFEKNLLDILETDPDDQNERDSNGSETLVYCLLFFV